MIATAIAHPNIALVKYWGKRDRALNLPAVPSLSMTLAPFETRTTVQWGAAEDRFEINGETASGSSNARIGAFLDLVDADRPPVWVTSTNNFPTDAGLASSSSAFAALALAATAAAGLQPSPVQLSTLARQGSGSAARSIWGGWVVWRTGERADGTDSHGEPIASSDHWDLRVLVALVTSEKKAVGSREGMNRTQETSPLYADWVNSGPADVAEAEAAVAARDLERLGTVMERSTSKMVATMHSSVPPIHYEKPKTLAVLEAIRGLRGDGVAAWTTMDAGPNVKVLTTVADAPAVAERLEQVVDTVHVLHLGGDARLV